VLRDILPVEKESSDQQESIQKSAATSVKLVPTSPTHNLTMSKEYHMNTRRILDLTVVVALNDHRLQGEGFQPSPLGNTQPAVGDLNCSHPFLYFRSIICKV
jgi:hypothetical protein